MNAAETYEKVTGEEPYTDTEINGRDFTISRGEYVAWLEAQLESMWLLHGNPHESNSPHLEGVSPNARELRVGSGGALYVNVGSPVTEGDL